MQQALSRRRFVALLAGAPALAAAGAPRIEGVLLKPGYGSGINGMVTVAYRPVVLFDDGQYTTDAAGALGAAPRIDGRWRRDGSRYVLAARDGKRTEIEARLRARPAERGAVLEGTYRSLGGVGSVAMNVPVVSASKQLRFVRDGSLHTDSAAGSTTATTATSSRSTAAARYRLDGWTITLSGADGTPSTRLFYFFPDGPGAIGVGAATFSLRR